MFFFAPIINLAILVSYLIMADDKQMISFAIPPWVWMLFVIHLLVRRYADGLQNTTRNLARIFLLRSNQDDGSLKRVSSIQILLTPHWAVPLALIWVTLSICSFAALLFHGGWLLALLGAILPIAGFPWILPIFYQHHLRRIQRYVTNWRHKERKIIEFLDHEILYPVVTDTLQEAIDVRRDPQEWWADIKYGKVQSGSRER